MSRSVLIDTNLLVLLIVGSASSRYIGLHKRTSAYQISDFRLLAQLVGQFSDIVTLPHVLAEVSSFTRNIAEPARSHVQSKFRDYILKTTEHGIASVECCQRPEFQSLGLTDAGILHVCAAAGKGASITLLTADTALANAASSLGYSVIDWEEYKAE